MVCEIDGTFNTVTTTSSETDHRCSGIALKPDGSMPLTALASFPRSGNTWARSLLEHSTGIYTGSVYWKTERELPVGSKVFLGGNIPYYSRSTLCVKTHLSKERDVDELIGGAILLLRDPYRAIVAEVFRKYMISTEEGPERALHFFKSKEWPHFVRRSAGEWLAVAINWTRRSKRLLVINYEDLQKDTEKELARMIDFLRQPFDSKRVVCAVQEHPSSESTRVLLGNHGIKARVYLTFDPFSKAMHKTIDRHIATVNATLAQYGNDLLPDYKYNDATYF